MNEPISAVAQRLILRTESSQKIYVSRQTDAEIVAAGAGQPAWRGSLHAINLILHHHFPAEEQRLQLGSGVNDAGGSTVSSDLVRGRDGRAFLLVGPDFGASTTGVNLPNRVAALRRALIDVMLWRLTSGWLTEADLAFPEVTTALRAADPLHLRRLLATPGVDRVDQGAKATITQLLAISTPVGAAATLQGDGSASETAGGVVVRLLPDTKAGTTNQTGVSFEPARVEVPATRTRNGRISTILGSLPQPPEVRIQTSYAATGPQSSLDPATVPSGYGAGTTAADRTSGRTSLRSHEGSHGAVYIDYFRNNPYRPFTGTVGMTVAAWVRERSAFMNAYTAWARGATTASLCQVDCVGRPTIDTYHAGTRGYVNVCMPCVAP